MPAITAPATVLVTGANGYIATYVIQYLIERGFNVRGTVRSTAKGESVKRLVRDNFTYVVIPDVHTPGAFDDAVKGVEVIESIGAAIPQDGSDPDVALKAAVDGTIGLLESARNAGTVKRVVITSTAFAEMQQGGETYHSEETWNDGAVELATQLGSQAPGILVYGASKVLAERAAFEYVKKHEGTINFDVVTLLPTYVFGPPINEFNPDIDVSFSSSAALLAGLTNPSKLPAWFGTDIFVDVRDVAEAHVQAILVEEAVNQRINLIGGEFSWDIAYKAVGLKRGEAPKDVDHVHTYASDKAGRVLGIKYRTAEESVKDSWAEFVTRGIVTEEGKVTS